VWIGRVPGLTAAYVWKHRVSLIRDERKRSIVTSTELVVKVNETKFERTIISYVNVIECMKIQNVNFSPKSTM